MTINSIIKLSHKEDFGHEYYAQIINFGKHWPRPFKNRSLVQGSVSWNDFPSWPYVQITTGNGTLFGAIFWIYKLGIDIDIIGRTWNFDYLEELDDGNV